MGKIIQFGLFQDLKEDKTHIGYQGGKNKKLSIYEIEGVVDESSLKKTISEVFGGNGISLYFGVAGPFNSYGEFFGGNLSMGGIMGNGVFFEAETLVLKKKGSKYYSNRDGREFEISEESYDTVVNAKSFFEQNFAKRIDVVREAPDPTKLENEEDYESFKNSLADIPDIEFLGSQLKELEERGKGKLPAQWILTLHFFIKALAAKYPEDAEPLKEARKQIWSLADGATFSALASDVVRDYIKRFPEISDTIIDSHPEIPISKNSIFYMGQTLSKVSRTEEQKAKVEQIREKWGPWS